MGERNWHAPVKIGGSMTESLVRFGYKSAEFHSLNIGLHGTSQTPIVDGSVDSPDRQNAALFMEFPGDVLPGGLYPVFSRQ